MKRVAIWTLVLLVLSACAVAESTVDLKSMNIGELIDLQQVIKSEIQARSNANDGSSGQLGINYVAIDHADIVYDRLDQKCIVITFVWKHSYKKFESFINLLEFEAFQDGVALDTSPYVESIKNHTELNAVQPGVYVQIQVAYELPNSTSPVEVEVYERYSKSNEKVHATFYFNNK